MRLSSTAAMLAATALLSSCSLFCELCKAPPDKPPEGAAGVTPRTPPACAFAGSKASSCFKRGNKNVCHIYVGEIGGVTHVFPSVLIVPRPELDTVVVWHLEVIGAQFRQGDGPVWKSGSGSEFEEGGPTDDHLDGDHQNKPSAKRYRVKFKNTAAGGAGPHDYTITYHKAGQPKSCDPQIVSQGD